jgi:hypothetical protein
MLVNTAARTVLRRVSIAPLFCHPITTTSVTASTPARPTLLKNKEKPTAVIPTQDGQNGNLDYVL